MIRQNTIKSFLKLVQPKIFCLHVYVNLYLSTSSLDFLPIQVSTTSTHLWKAQVQSRGCIDGDWDKNKQKWDTCRGEFLYEVCT